MGQHPFVIVFQRIIAFLYGTGGSPEDGILDASVDRPGQFQSGGLRPALLIRSTAGSDKSDTAVLMQLRSILEPPGGIEIGEDGRRANHANTRKLTPGLDDGIFAGIGAELFLRQLNLLFGSIIADPEHVQLGFQDGIVEP